MTSLTLTIESTDYEITFTNKQGTIELPYAMKLPGKAKVKAVELSAKATGVKVGETLTIPASGHLTLTITAEDKKTTQEYTVTVQKVSANSEASITALTLTVGSTDYEVTFTNKRGTIKIPYSTKLPVKARVAAVQLSAKATGVKVGETLTIPASEPLTLTITAEDETTTQEYTVTVQKAAPNSEALITALTLTVGSTDYEIDFTDRAHTLTLPAGSTLPTRVGVKTIALSAGATSDAGNELSVTDNMVTLTVTAENGTTTQEYMVTLSVAANVGAAITSLTLRVGDRDYEIIFQGTRGTVIVPYDTEIPAQVEVKKIALSDGATSDTNNGNELEVTDNAITITVTAEDSTTESAYTVMFSVAASSEASINTLTLTVADTDYEIMFTDNEGTMALPYSTEIPAKVGVKQIELSTGATSNADNELSVTDNAITITVTAEDGTTTQEYTVTVQKADPNSEALITDLTLMVGDKDYKVTFTGTQDTLRVGPYGTPIPARVVVKQIALSVGAKGVADDDELTVTNNTLTLTVTAEDGMTTQEYTVVLGFTTVGITSFTFEVPDNESMALDMADRQQIVGKIDQETKTITFAQQSAYVYRDKLKATFALSEAGVGVQVGDMTQTSGVTEQDFTSPVSYVVRAQEGTETTYTVTLLKSTLATIPDDNFRTKLKEFVPAAFTGDQLDIMHDNVINKDGELNVRKQTPKLTSLKGIEFFTALTNLKCNNNGLTSLDVSANTALATLDCGFNELTSLNVSGNTALTTLYCNNNSLPSLDIRVNTALTDLECSANRLPSLDVSANTALTDLSCVGNSLTSLDVSANTALTDLGCEHNSLTSLDVSANTALTKLYCYSNSLTSLDITGMRSVAFALALAIGKGTGEDNLLKTLRVNTALQDHAAIRTMKTNRGVELTITTVNNDGEEQCANYIPAENGGNCNQAP